MEGSWCHFVTSLFASQLFVGKNVAVALFHVIESQNVALFSITSCWLLVFWKKIAT